jgi:hypothetical protein
VPWIESSSLIPPLTTAEREIIADGKAVTRQVPDGVIVITPRSIITSYGKVSGLGITYGPNGEDAFLHIDGRVEETKPQSFPASWIEPRGVHVE